MCKSVCNTMYVHMPGISVEERNLPNRLLFVGVVTLTLEGVVTLTFEGVVTLTFVGVVTLTFVGVVTLTLTVWTENANLKDITMTPILARQCLLQR